MQKVILASASPHRKKLLRLLGIPFCVKPSRAREAIRIRTTCAALVKQNALKKAREVAAKIKDGIVIGADTVVYSGKNRIIGKPKSFSHAKKILKFLSRRPQWVYTGLAVINAKTKREIVGYEKTKVLMRSLSDKEIGEYHRDVFPLDKAGGFDIQGRGSRLIKKIEGCRFNVIGLPLVKLSKMLKKAGIIALVIFALVPLNGCATEYNLATGREETTFIGTDKEINIGEAIARELENEVKLVTDIDVNERISRIFKKIVAVCDRRELVYSVKIIDDDKVNAVSLPGGSVYVYKGLIDNAANDDQLAGIIGHEVGHITARHSIKKMESLYGFTFLKLLAVTSGSGPVAQGLDLAFASIFTAYSMEDEFLADKLGIKYAKAAGYDPSQMAAFLKKLGEIQAKESSKEYSYWRTHPYIPQRISAVNQEVKGTLEFKDYLNLTGEQ